MTAKMFFDFRSIFVWIVLSVAFALVQLVAMMVVERDDTIKTETCPMVTQDDQVVIQCSAKTFVASQSEMEAAIKRPTNSLTCKTIRGSYTGSEQIRCE